MIDLYKGWPGFFYEIQFVLVVEFFQGYVTRHLEVAITLMMTKSS